MLLDSERKRNRNLNMETRQKSSLKMKREVKNNFSLISQSNHVEGLMASALLLHFASKLSLLVAKPKGIRFKALIFYAPFHLTWSWTTMWKEKRLRSAKNYPRSFVCWLCFNKKLAEASKRIMLHILRSRKTTTYKQSASVISTHSLIRIISDKTKTNSTGKSYPVLKFSVFLTDIIKCFRSPSFSSLMW